MNKMNGESFDIVASNIEKLREVFPDAFREEKIDFEHLRMLLGDYIDESKEKYSLSWNGKSNAVRIAQTSSKATLRPEILEKNESVDSKNLYIEGENLEVLKLLQKSYYSKIKVIYIDPPYNTGNDFVYKDNFNEPLKEYLKVTNQINEEGKSLSSNTETSGRYHTNWLNMMYPRLRLARNLLKDDGVIFISIDEIEYANLIKICDEIFGEYNHIADFVWQKKKGGGNDAKYVAVEHEYVVMYAKNETALHDLFEPYKPEYLKRYKEEDVNGRFYWDTFKRKSGKQYYPIKCPDGTVLEYDSNNNPISWLRSEKRFYEDLENGEIRFVQNGGEWSVHFKQRLPKGKKPRSIFFEDSIWDNVASNSNASAELLDLFGKDVFDTPKPINLIKKVLGFSVNDEDIVLDFFSGSATTGEAVYRSNIENGKNARFILVQLPEPIQPNTQIANNAIQYLSEKNLEPNICELAKERLKLSIKKINEEYKEQLNTSLGFKVFKLDKSNIKEWNPDIDTLEITLESTVNNFVEGRTYEDILYEIMLKYGIDLAVPVEEFDVDGSKVFSVGFGALLVCLEDNLNVEIAKGIVDLIKDLSPELTRVVFKDNGFKSDSVKTNVIQTLKRHNIDEVVSI